MAKGIRERLLKQAIKFHQWQEATYPGKTSEELGGEWEVDYPYWNDTYTNIFLKRLIIYRPLLYNEDGDEK